ncbi:MAG: hypothetical protein ABFS32_16310 [Bacteroidota bacterium]
MLVFNFLTEFENIPLWNYYVTEVKQVSVQNEGSEKYRQVRQNDFQVFEILDRQFPERIVIKTTDESKIGFKRSFRLSEDHSNNSILDDHFEIDLGYSQILQQLFRHKIRNAVKANLKKLKELLETGATVLQDGRISKFTMQH